MGSYDMSSGELLLKSIARRKDVDAADRKRAREKYGHVEYADEKNEKYPINDEEHIRAAWDYINKGEDADKYSPEDVERIKHKIVSAWKRKIDKAGPPSAGAEDMKKGKIVGSYDEALVKAIEGKGSEDLDRLMKGGLGIRTENSGNQNAPDAPTQKVGKGAQKGYGPGDAGTGKNSATRMEGSGAASVDDDEDREGATEVERAGKASVKGFEPLRTEDSGDQNAPGAADKKVGNGQPKGYARG